MLKRAFDLTAAVLGLVLLSPLLLAVALWVKLDSPGPVFFRQERVGRGGRLFRIHKFRTMVHDAAQAGLPLTVGQDERITRAGRFLRRHRLDELPQLFDVLRGEMSLVGPRPEVPSYVAHYPEHLRDKLLSVRPGLTDPASLAHLDESERLGRSSDPERTYIEEILPAKLRQAEHYVDHASLTQDLRVLWRTLCTLMAGR
ncbi:sugar transferase [Caldimonas sp.]|uniref:sugar transferase n=1 Tax=Caldimonas sp. TaxID=2838790 RepID=UPI003918910F